ncbi:serine/arginine repetitive matrix protein 1 isoform X2 [Aplysia californica]|uniref:Protein CASC3 n=1 Tax=Aplysia californica TaxID=6500 RepID=A0ABM0JTV7_APLCA|nr:serine/arginine repetitive matrix protein 1 isoform X2 [Aplysia californica]
MSVSDRRRRRLEDEGEEGDSEEKSRPTSASRPSECESEELSEYESAADENGDPEEEETEEGSETETEEGSESEEESETGTETEGGYTDEEGLEEERQSGDGEEQPEKDKPDDDEDKKNPAYVPRRGAFYEHDFRQGDEGPEGEEGEDLKPKKKLWQDEGKWAHDRYTDESQAPKSREELITLYGYDIRAADKAPEMPPRRMGRGRGGPRRQKFQDFMPRMAVIDTTEDGADTIPNLDDDGFVQYESGRGRNSERRRGSRGGSSYRGGMLSNNRGYHENKAHRYDSGRSQDARATNDYPTLEEISRQTERWDEQRNKNPQDSYKNESKKYNQKQDSYRREERQDYGRYQQNNNERRGAYNNNARRGGEEDNWRSAQSEYRGSGDMRNQGSSAGDDFNWTNHGSNPGYGYKKTPQHDLRRADQNLARLSDAGGNKRGTYQNQEQSHYRNLQQHAVPGSNGTRESKEYTNASYQSREDRAKQRGPHDEASTGDAGDSNTRSSKNVVISNKENIQTINVTITSTTTEKKSYAKERRGKGTTRAEDGAGHLGHPDPRTVTQTQSGHGQGLSSQVAGDPGATASGGTTVSKRYSSQRQQAMSKGSFTGPPPVDSGAKLYNPALPPPSFFQCEPGTVGPHTAAAPASTVQDSTHFPPALLPPAPPLPYGLPVSSTTLGLPPPTPAASVPSGPAAIFRPPRGPPPPGQLPNPGAALISPPYLPAGMMYGGGPRVPPPGTPAGFPIPLAYTSPPPPPTTAAAVHAQQQSQGSASQPGTQSSAQPKKVYRGDITYYAPELQQPSRTPQKRPKAAIPIVDPQEMRRQKQKEKSDQRSTPDKNCNIKKEITPPRIGGSKDSPKAQTDLSSIASPGTSVDKLKQETHLVTQTQSSTPSPSVPLNSGYSLLDKSAPLTKPNAASKCSDGITSESCSSLPNFSQQLSVSVINQTVNSFQCNQNDGQTGEKEGSGGKASPVEITTQDKVVAKVIAPDVPAGIEAPESLHAMSQHMEMAPQVVNEPLEL